MKTETKIRLADGEKILLEQRKSRNAIIYEIAWSLFWTVVVLILCIMGRVALGAYVLPKAPTAAMAYWYGIGASLMVVVIMIVNLWGVVNGFIDLVTYKVVVTTRRIYHADGWIGYYDDELMLHKVESCETWQDWIRRLLGYGSVTVYGTGSQRILMRHMDNHRQLARVIEAAVSPYQKKARSGKGGGV